MMTRRSVLSLLAGAPALALGGCSTWPRTVRYRLTLVVDTPEAERTGSSVVEKKTIFQDGFLGGLVGYRLLNDIRGEATAIDLGRSGSLFVLLSSDPSRAASAGADYLVQRAFPPSTPKIPYDSDKFIASYYDDLNARLPKAGLLFDQLPMLVRFRDIADPKSVERVDPNDLAKSFGPGVSLKRAIIEITNDAVTTGIVKKLPWLADGYPEKRLVAATGGPVGDVPPAHLLTYSSFKGV